MEAKEKQTQVAEELTQLGKATSEVDTMIRDLFTKLSPILREMLSEPQDEPTEDSLVPLACDLRFQRRKIETIRSQIENILNRLEL